MAKKQNSDPPAPTPASKPQRRTTKRTTSVPPVDNVMVPPPLAASGNGDRNDTVTPHARPEPSYDDIAQAAYLRYLNRGATPGGDFDDWLEAERDLRRKG